MSFNEKVQDLINNYIRDFNIKPNELFLGIKESKQLEEYANTNEIPITIDNYYKIYGKFEFRGLKVRFSDKKSDFRAEFNPHYK